MKALGKRNRIVRALGLLLLLAAVAVGVDRGGSLKRSRRLLKQWVIFEAIHELEMFVAEHPDHEEARMELARTLHRVKRERRTAEEAAHVLRINPDNSEARRLLTRIRIKLGRDLDRTDPVAVLDYARLCTRPETYDRAADFYRLYLDLDDDPLVHMEFAKMLYWAERYDEARAHLETYMAYKPDDVDMRQLLGRIVGSMGDYESAAKAYRQCLEVRPNDMDIQLDLARALMWSGQEEEAEKMLKEISRRSAEFDAPLILLASIARIQGRVQDEYDLYKTVLETNPNNKEAQKRVAELEAGNLLAIAVYTDRLVSYPEDDETRRKLVDLYRSEERYAQAYFLYVVLFFSLAKFVLFWWGQLTVLDIVVAMFCLSMERESMKLVPYSILYRIYFVVLTDVCKVIASIEELLQVQMSWGKLERTGRMGGEPATEMEKE